MIVEKRMPEWVISVYIHIQVYTQPIEDRIFNSPLTKLLTGTYIQND